MQSKKFCNDALYFKFLLQHNKYGSLPEAPPSAIGGGGGHHHNQQQQPGSATSVSLESRFSHLFKAPQFLPPPDAFTKTAKTYPSDYNKQSQNQRKWNCYFQITMLCNIVLHNSSIYNELKKYLKYSPSPSFSAGWIFLYPICFLKKFACIRIFRTSQKSTLAHISVFYLKKCGYCE